MGLGEFFKNLFIDKSLVKDIEFLKRVPLFEDLSNKVLAELLNVSNRRHYEQNEIVFTEGRIGRILYIVKSGEVAAFSETKESVRLHEGEYFGERALLEETVHRITVRAVRESELLLLYKVKFDGFLQDDPRAGIAILKKLALKCIHARDKSSLKQGG